MNRTLHFAAIMLVAIATVPAYAATKLPQLSTDSSCAGKPVNQACGGTAQTGQIYKTPAPTDVVRIMADGSTSANWDSPAYQWAMWKDVAAGQLYDSCLDDVPEGSPVTGSLCRNWGMVPKQASVTPTFSVTPVTGRAPLNVKVAWNVPDGSACQAGGAWSGSQASSGSQDLTLDAGSKSFTLTCTRPIGPPAKGQAVVTWTPATKNTDDSAYTNPRGVIITRNTTETLVAPPSLTTYTFSALDPGTHSFRAQSVNAADTRSDYTNAIEKVIPATPTPVTWSATPISFVVDPPLVAKPNPPVLSVQ